MALTADALYEFSQGTEKGRDAQVKASTTIYRHAALGDSSGYARGLVAGDRFCGFAVDHVDNSSGSAGDKHVEIYYRGAAVLAITSAAITDKYKAVFASADGTFTFTESTNSYVGVAMEFVWVEPLKMWMGK